MSLSYIGKLYRALNPVYAREPLSGRGAAHYGGRFNPKGTPALYTSLSPVTALREANQVGNLQPTTLVAYEAQIETIFDTRDVAELAAYDLDIAGLSAPTWRDEMKATGQSKTQTFAKHLINSGFHGLIVRSFAPGSGEEDLNLVLWSWSSSAPSRLSLIDDEGRLSG